MKVIPIQDRPRVVDNDRGVIVVNLKGRQIRGWSYQSDDERRKKTQMAREYVEGWCDGHDYNAQPFTPPKSKPTEVLDLASFVCDPHFWDTRGVCLKCGAIRQD